MHSSLDDWARDEAIAFSLYDSGNLDAAIDRIVGRIDGAVSLLGLGEGLHGGEEILQLRNRLFRRLVEKHGYSAIAIESSLPRGRLVNEYVAGRGPGSYDELRDKGFSHGFGRFESTRELVEWMREYNARPGYHRTLFFYGFDSPTEMTHTDSPRQLLELALAHLGLPDPRARDRYRERMDPLIGDDAAWENPEAMMDPSKSNGMSPEATALRCETEDLIAELESRRPELMEKMGTDRFLETLHCAKAARCLLTYHALLAKPLEMGDRLVRGLGMRDAMMAENLAYALSREQGRGKVLAFAHNSHLQRTPARWQLGPHLLAWWPAGAQLEAMLGAQYAVIGTGVVSSAENGIGAPDPGTLEALLAATPGSVRFVPTHRGEGLRSATVEALGVRSRSTKNSTYFPLTSESLAAFDGLVVFDSVKYTRGAPPL
jgi:erythromycin esterase-like protein